MFIPISTRLSFITLFLMVFSCSIVFGQEEEYVKDDHLRYYDHVYKKHIKTALLHPEGHPVGFPAIKLNGSGKLHLSFDDLEGGTKDFTYTIVHCNADWKPSELTDMEYIDGFNPNEIEQYDYSFNTLVDFTHYQLLLPNDDMAITKSGNYLLKVYVDDDEEDLVLTKRFMVLDNEVGVEAHVLRANSRLKSRTHQEIDFAVSYSPDDIRNPRAELKTFVLQNGRWDNAIHDIKPLFVRENKLIYDYQDEIVFPGGKEFIVADLRSTRYTAEHIAVLKDDKDRYYMAVDPDVARAGRAYTYRGEANGKFVIENLHEDDFALESDYIRTTFTLARQFPDDAGDFYLFGALSDWQVREEFKMRYDTDLSAYQCTVDLKQGYYNYSYAYVKGGTATADMTKVDGSWYETENDYYILVYFRPFAGRYDQLIGVHVVNSLRN